MENKNNTINFSKATRIADIEPDLASIKKYDIYYKKYRTLWNITLVIAFVCIFVASRLWKNEHGVWGGLLILIGLVVLFIGNQFRTTAGSGAYSSGLLIPSIILSENPITLLSLADMRANDETEQEVWGVKKTVLTELPYHRVQAGARIPTVAMFSSAQDGIRQTYEPRPIAWATTDPVTIDNAIAEIDEEEWGILNILKSQVDDLDEDKVKFFDHKLSTMSIK